MAGLAPFWGPRINSTGGSRLKSFSEETAAGKYMAGSNINVGRGFSDRDALGDHRRQQIPASGTGMITPTPGDLRELTGATPTLWPSATAHRRDRGRKPQRTRQCSASVAGS